MRSKFLCLAVLIAAFAGFALAQNHISTTVKCDGKPDTQQSVEVGDQPGHVLILEKGGGGSNCTWSVPMQIGGLKATAITSADTVDLIGTKFQMQGYSVIAMENGDEGYARFQGAGNVKEGIATAEGTWSFTGGTGRLNGLKGKGTFKTSGPPEGGPGELKMEGGYSLPDTKLGT